MRGLLRFLLYAAAAVALVWTGSLAYQRLTGAGGGRQASSGSADAMKSAIWVP